MSKGGNDASNDSSLERSLGLLAALTIGTGTMIGAGIFVFPGIAAGRTGMAAVLSFTLGALIALVVALSTSELATAMPESGGGYYFVSRGLGSYPGTLVGLGQWLGLVFAAAFYLVGFGHYFRKILDVLEVPALLPAHVLGLALACVLVAVNLVGTENSGEVQNFIVSTLLAILVFVLGYGFLYILGPEGRESVSRSFAPRGYTPVLTTAALVFTSYLGFAQIATVAGEISEPSVNLPRAMVGSVILVGLLYVTAVFVSVRTLGMNQLEQHGETAMVEVARSLLGRYGALFMVSAGLLATVSSANASILSSSRALYALSRDGIVPKRMASVSRRFGTPHYSLLSTGALIVFCILIGGLERLAEVASLLHLLMYGLICLALIRLRNRDPDWYEPTFHSWGNPGLPFMGGLACFSLIGFMEDVSIVYGLVFLLVASGWYGALTLTDGVQIHDGA